MSEGASPLASSGERRLGQIEAVMVGIAAFVLLPLVGAALARLGITGLVATEAIAVAGPVAVALAATRTRPSAALGLAWPGTRVMLAALVAGAGGFYFASAGIEQLQEHLVPLPVELRDQMRALLLPSDGPRPLALDLMALALVPALCEEALFRGALLRALANSPVRETRVLALIITSAAFGCFHFSLYKLVPTAALGALMGSLALCSGSLWPAVAAHALNNLLVIVCFRAGWEEPPGAHSPLLPLWLACSVAAMVLGVRNASSNK